MAIAVVVSCARGGAWISDWPWKPNPAHGRLPKTLQRRDGLDDAAFISPPPVWELADSDG